MMVREDVQSDVEKGETLLIWPKTKREPKMSVTADGFITEIDGRAQNQVKEPILGLYGKWKANQ